MSRPDLRQPVMLLAFGLGSGLASRAPGTFGSLAALVLFFPLALLPLPAYLGLLVVSGLAGIFICGEAARRLGVHDHAGIVWDEFVGQWLTLLPLAAAGRPTPSLAVWALLGFALFRLFDISKPWPIRWADRQVHGGLGIMLDDVLAAVPAGLILVACRHLAGA